MKRRVVAAIAFAIAVSIVPLAGDNIADFLFYLRTSNIFRIFAVQKRSGIMEVKVVFINSTDVQLVRSNRSMVTKLRFKHPVPDKKQENYARTIEILLAQAKHIKGKEHNQWQQLEYVNKKLTANKDFPNSFQRLVTDKELTRAYIGAKLQSIRKKRKLSLRGLAQLSGIDYGNLSKIENGNVSVGLDVLCRLMQALDVHIDFIEKIAFDKIEL